MVVGDIVNCVEMDEVKDIWCFRVYCKQVKV